MRHLMSLFIFATLSCARPSPTTRVASTDGRCWKFLVVEGVEVQGGFPVVAVEVPCQENR